MLFDNIQTEKALAAIISTKNVYLMNCGVKPSNAWIEAGCAHRAPKDPYPHRPAIHEKVDKVDAYAQRQAALRATVIPTLQHERAAVHVDEEATLQPKFHNEHAIDKVGEAKHKQADMLSCRLIWLDYWSMKWWIDSFTIAPAL